MGDKPIIAIPVGDPAGIGPEISLKAALDLSVRAMAQPILVGDPGVIERHAKACGIATDFLILDEINGAGRPDGRLPLLAVLLGRGRRHSLRRHERRERTALACGCARGHSGAAPTARRRRRRCPAEPDLDCARRHRIRRLPVLRRAGNRPGAARCLPDALLRRREDRALHAARQRQPGDCTDHPRAGGVTSFA